MILHLYIYILKLIAMQIDLIIRNKPSNGFYSSYSIDFFHSVGVNLIDLGVVEWWQVIILGFVILED